MGCNCATQEQIKKLHQLYGEKKNEPISLTQKIQTFFNKIGVYFILILISPLLILYVLYKALFAKDKRISIRRIFRFNRTRIDEAIAKNIIENTTILKNEQHK
jgi:hypothetical protein